MKFNIFLLLITFSLFNCSSQKSTLYVGTYTKGASEGIYKLDFNSKTGVIDNKQLAVKTENPSFIAFSPDKKYIYAVGEGETSAITAFKVEKDETLSFINKQGSKGKGPCHVSVNKTGNKTVVSNYGGGTAAVYSINKNGSLTEATQVFNHNTATEKARAHSAQFYKDDLFVSDLGRNAVYQYKLQGENYRLESPSISKMEGNPGPRHFSISKNGEFIYIINEYGGSITSIKRTDNGFKQIDLDSTLRDNYKGKNSCADIHLSQDERFLYGSNRGENSIAVFKRNTETGTIEKIQNMSVHGDWPRNFNLDPTGRFLLVANQYSENISVFSINQQSGKLTYLHSIDLPSPVCILF